MLNEDAFSRSIYLDGTMPVRSGTTVGRRP